MSDVWHTTRLHFEGYAGVAKLHGHSVRLTAMPVLPGLPERYVAIDYIPEIGMVRIMPLGKAWRDMEPPEIKAADQALRDLAG